MAAYLTAYDAPIGRLTGEYPAGLLPARATLASPRRRKAA
jgi:hypothetical protein